MRTWIEGMKAWRYLPHAAILFLSALIGAAGFSMVQSSTKQLLESEARADAKLWMDYLSRNFVDLPMVVKGQVPSGDMIKVLDQARRIGRVYSFRAYDASGRLKLRSDDFSRTLSRNQPIEKIDADFAEALKTGAPATFVRQGKVLGEPDYYASTILPVMENGSIAGWIVAKIDQSDRQNRFFSFSVQATIAIVILLILAPIFGFWHGTRQMALIERKLEKLSQRDQLTGLPNKANLLKTIDRHLSAPESAGKQCALILCEIADIAALEQSFGHEATDNAILITSNRLSELKPEWAEVGYLDRGRFGMLVPHVTDSIAVLSLAKELTTKLSEKIERDNDVIAFQVHAGIGLSSSDGADSASLLRSTELALRSAQEQGTPGYGFFNPEIAQDTRRRVAVQKAIVDAVDAQSFRLDFQPVYNIRTGELTGFEALIRLHDEDLGAVSPAEFIPVAEQMGLINKIGAWCLDEACRVASQWPSHLVVAVNLSPHQFYAGSLISDIRQALERNHFPAYRLEVEITEGTLLKDSELVLRQLHALREIGVAVALDDFGTGYSSLSYLWKFPFSKIKIDRSFIHALDETQSARGILRSIIKLGHGLGLSVTAEGIESAKQLSALRDLGCDLAQGFLLDRPARTADLAAIIMRNFAQGLTRKTRGIGIDPHSQEEQRYSAHSI